MKNYDKISEKQKKVFQKIKYWNLKWDYFLFDIIFFEDDIIWMKVNLIGSNASFLFRKYTSDDILKMEEEYDLYGTLGQFSIVSPEEINDNRKRLWTTGTALEKGNVIPPGVVTLEVLDKKGRPYSLSFKQRKGSVEIIDYLNTENKKPSLFISGDVLNKVCDYSEYQDVTIPLSKDFFDKCKVLSFLDQTEEVFCNSWVRHLTINEDHKISNLFLTLEEFLELL